MLPALNSNFISKTNLIFLIVLKGARKKTKKLKNSKIPKFKNLKTQKLKNSKTQKLKNSQS